MIRRPWRFAREMVKGASGVTPTARKLDARVSDESFADLGAGTGKDL